MEKSSVLRMFTLLLFFVLMILSNIGAIELFFGGQLVFGSVFLFILLKVSNKKTTILLAIIIFGSVRL